MKIDVRLVKLSPFPKTRKGERVEFVCLNTKKVSMTLGEFQKQIIEERSTWEAPKTDSAVDVMKTTQIVYNITMAKLGEKMKQALMWGKTDEEDEEGWEKVARDIIEEEKMYKEKAKLLPNRDAIDFYLKLGYEYSDIITARKEVQDVFKLSPELSHPIVAEAVQKGWIVMKPVELDLVPTNKWAIVNTPI